MSNEKSKPEIIDMTPTWADMVPTLLALMIDGNAEVRRTARTEIARMAQAADLYNLSVKSKP